MRRHAGTFTVSGTHSRGADPHNETGGINHCFVSQRIALALGSGVSPTVPAPNRRAHPDLIATACDALLSKLCIGATNLSAMELALEIVADSDHGF